MCKKISQFFCHLLSSCARVVVGLLSKSGLPSYDLATWQHLVRTCVTSSTMELIGMVGRGKAEAGKDLIMARDYVTHGIRQRAGQLLSLELEPEIEFDKQMKLARSINAERFTKLDRSILKYVDQDMLTISAMPPTEPHAHTSHMRRFKHLSDLGLANELQKGVWEIDPDVERILRSLGKKNDIIATMHRAMREAKIDRPGANFAIFDTEASHRLIIGRVAAATRLANAGCTTEQIKSITRHKTLSEVAGYTRAADQERNAKQALANLLRSESEQNSPTFDLGLDKFGEK